MRFVPATFCLAAVLAVGVADAEVVPFNFQGNAGFGLLPGNEIGSPTPVSEGVMSPAIGGETGLGLVYDTDTNVLDFSFDFSGLTGGLADIASGIHFHVITSGAAPFDGTGGIAFNLNTGTDPNVMLATPLVAVDGSATSGMVAGTATFNEAQEAALFAGNYYLNIHSGGFGAGELRANLVPVPEPGAAAAMAALAAIGFVRARRR